MKHLSELYWRTGERFEIVGSILVLYLSTVLYFTRLDIAQTLALVLLTVLGILLAVSVWLGPYRLNRHDLGLTLSGAIRESVLGFMLAFWGWWLYSEYLHVTRGYRLTVGLNYSRELLITIFCIATAEELFFRSYAHARFVAWFPTIERALAVSVSLGLYKNLVHFWEWQPVLYHVELFLLTFVLSLPLSMWRETSKSIVGPLVTHIVWDLLVYGPLESIPIWIF